MALELIKRAQSGWVALAQVSQQREENMDVIVPDVSPDVFTVLSVTASCTLGELAVRQDCVELTGSAEVLVLYTAEDERVCTLRGVLPIRHVCEAAGCTEGCIAQARLEAATASASVLNPRKLALRVTVAEEVELLREQPFELCEDVEGEEDEGLQCRRAAESCLLLAAAGERRISFTEELRLHGEAAGGSLLLRSEVAWQTEEARVMANRVLVRGTAELKVLTVSDSGAYAGSCVYSLPFSQMLECERAEPGDRAEVSIVTTALDCRLLPGEEVLRLSLSLSGSLAARLWREQRLQAVDDLFSTRWSCTLETAEVGGERMGEPSEAREEVSERIECPPVAQVCDWSCCTRAEGLPDGGTMGHFWFRILCRGEDGCLRTVCRRCDVPLSLPCARRSALRPDGVRLAPTEGGLSLSFTAVLAGMRAAPRALRQVCACKLDRTSLRSRPEPGTLLLRAAGPSESLWSIAKQYGVPPELLRTANHLAADAAITPGQLIVVPFAG